ncbi:MAG: hypothetical protein GF404_08025 [candidate division Zixibacteria bacterium]|nr:hypothetical protein [candidate division Zixibacteria bacterium]
MRFFCHVFALLVVFTLNVFAEGEDCDNRKAIDVYDYSDLPHMVTATTCGMGNDYE